MKIITNNKKDLRKVKESVKRGNIIAFPTETVFGVGVIYNNYNSYIALNKLKRRDPDKPYTMMVYSINTIKKFAITNKKIIKFLKNFMPGSLTVILPIKNQNINYIHKDGYIGFRIPSNKIALDVLKIVKEPMLITSLNRNGLSPINEINEIKKEFDSEIDYAINGEITSNVPSTVIMIKEDKLILIREGLLSFKSLQEEYNKL